LDWLWAVGTALQSFGGVRWTLLMLSAVSLIDELETTMRVGSGAQRAEILQRVTQLFLQNADSYGDRQVAM
jgi:hypothetical protein